jgi:hypothetical protein
MTVGLYMDHHVPRAITSGLRLRRVDVLTAAEDGAATLADPDLLDRATALGRVLFSQDDDLLVEAKYRQTESLPFSGVIYCHQRGASIGDCVRELELIATVLEPFELQGRVLYLPL